MQTELQLEQFAQLDSEIRSLFIRHLGICCGSLELARPKRSAPTAEPSAYTKNFIARVCIPILKAIHEHGGITQPAIDLVQLAEGRGFRRSEIERIINEAFAYFQSTLPSSQVAKYLGCSPGHARKIIARLCKINGDIIKERQGWLVPVVALDSYLVGESA